MNAEYQRLEAEANEVQQQINELVSSCNQRAAEFQKFEARIARQHQRLAGLRQGMGLLKLTGSARMQAEAAMLAKSQPKTFHSQGTRPKTVQLTGGVTVTLHRLLKLPMNMPCCVCHQRRDERHRLYVGG